jgi:hypothetical protein
MNESITMVMLPQPVWEQVLQELSSIKAALEVRGSAVPERIPIARFKSDKSLVERYGVGYTVVRELALKGQLRSYRDENRERGRWTTHSDLMRYFESVKKEGFAA